MKSHNDEYDPLDRLLERLREGPATDASVAQAVDQLVTDTRSHEVSHQRKSFPSRKSRSPRWKVAVGLSIVAATVGVPLGAAAVSEWTAHTGVFGGTGSEVSDDSEWIAIHADDAPEAIKELFPSYIDLPPGATANDVINPVSDQLDGLGGDDSQPQMQASTVQQFFETGARCLWYRYWLYSDLTGNVAELQLATTEIQEAVRWPAIASSDGGGVVDYLQQQADAAAAGDRALMVRYYGRTCDDYGRIFK
ncbi:hypothetical protein [Herbiconiux liangxiaofengii]|uniref:hypothetical protein n=1 Tax=Herbiconiux liangxiaofengii TaxID=3342795 RepID=UPI0035B945BA